MSKYLCMEQRLIVNSVLDIETGCWVWIAARDKRASTPYGKISVWVPERGKPLMRQAHIVSYETFIGPVPSGHEIDHTCRDGFCINPGHLEAVQPHVNKDRRVFNHTAKTTTYKGNDHASNDSVSSGIYFDTSERDLLGSIQYCVERSAPNCLGDLVGGDCLRWYAEHASLAHESLDAY